MESVGRPAWAERLHRERKARGWTQAETVQALRAHATQELPDDLLRQWKRWESGQVKPERYARLIASLFGTVTAAFFDDGRVLTPAATTTASAAHGNDLVRVSDMDTMEIIERIRRSDVNTPVLEMIQFKADQLCSQYAYTPAATLRTEGREWLNRIMQLLHSRLTLTQHREVLVTAGWLSLLVGCVEYDSGDTQSAEATRLAAQQLGQEAGHSEIVAWAHEMTAWQALTQGRYRQVIEATRAGRAANQTHSVAVQLLAQEAKAWARMGDRHLVESALEQGRVLLDELPYPANPEHHFVVDPNKFDFYVMDCYRRAGDDKLAEMYAYEVIRKATAPDGTERSPMRMAEARVTLGVTAARRGDLYAAESFGAQALSGPRKSLPSLRMVASELKIEMQRQSPTAPETRAFTDRLSQCLSSSGPFVEPTS